MGTTNSNNCNFQQAQYLKKLGNKKPQNVPLVRKFHFSALLLMFQSCCTLALLYKANYTYVYIANFYGFCVFQYIIYSIQFYIPGTSLRLLLFTGSRRDLSSFCVEVQYISLLDAYFICAFLLVFLLQLYIKHRVNDGEYGVAFA